MKMPAKVNNVKRNQYRSKEYGRLNLNVGLNSEYLSTVPSLHLIEEDVSAKDEGEWTYISEKPSFQIDINADNQLISRKPSSYATTTIAASFNVKQDPVEKLQVAPDMYFFSKLDVVLHGPNSMYEENLRFRKTKNLFDFPYEGCCKLYLTNRCTSPVSFKVVSNGKDEEVRALPNVGVVPCGEEVALAIYLKKYEPELMNSLIFKICVAMLDKRVQPQHAWKSRRSILSSTPHLRCVLIDDDMTEDAIIEFDDGDEQQQKKKDQMKISPRPTYVPETVKWKHERRSMFNKLFKNISKAWQRLRGKSKKKN